MIKFIRLSVPIQLVAISFAIMSCTNFQEEEIPVGFGVDVNELQFSSISATRSITVSSGTKWDVSSMPDWMGIQSINRSGSSLYEWTVLFSASANDEYNREGTITINSDSETMAISVTQEGKKGQYVAIESVSLSHSELSLSVGESALLTAVINPSDASVKKVTWSSSSPFIASVDDNGRISATAEGKTLIIVTTEDGKRTAQCSVFVSGGMENGHPWVDLGLSSGLKWAKCNVGASSPEAYGDYFAWGETEPYYETGYAQLENPKWKGGKEAGYRWETYKWCLGEERTLTKYCTNSSYGYNNFYDGKTALDLEDDAAHVNFGGKWRMPTDAEMTELLYQCTWEITQMNGVIGIKGTGPNENSIFLPAAGNRERTNFFNAGDSGEYWTSSLSPYTPSDPVNASMVYFFRRNDPEHLIYTVPWQPRYAGHSIRPVTD